MPDLILFEENRAYVVDQFHNGHFDYIEAVQEVAQRDFFRYVADSALLKALAATYPHPRKKQEVPCWFYLAADMAMRLHGNHAFHGFPWVVATGGLLSAFGPKLGTHRMDPGTGELRIECPGFNRKNAAPRRTPCDPDYLRKVAADTPPEALLEWFNTAVQRTFKRHRFFDKSGLFIGDGSYLFVPDNPNYEGSARMLFDEHNRPVSQEAHARMTPGQASRCHWRRCYKLVSLLHVAAGGDYFLYAGLAILPGNTDGYQHGYAAAVVYTLRLLADALAGTVAKIASVAIPVRGDRWLADGCDIGVTLSASATPPAWEAVPGDAVAGQLAVVPSNTGTDTSATVAFDLSAAPRTSLAYLHITLRLSEGGSSATSTATLERVGEVPIDPAPDVAGTILVPIPDGVELGRWGSLVIAPGSTFRPSTTTTSLGSIRTTATPSAEPASSRSSSSTRPHRARLKHRRSHKPRLEPGGGAAGVFWARARGASATPEVLKRPRDQLYSSVVRHEESNGMPLLKTNQLGTLIPERWTAKLAAPPPLSSAVPVPLSTCGS